MDVLRDETILELTLVDWENGEVASEARREAARRGLLDAGNG